MKIFTKSLTGAAAAALVTLTAAAPAQAQYQYPYDPYARGRGIDVGDIARSVAVAGAAAAAVGALGNAVRGGLSGYGYGGYGYGEQAAVDACAYQAQRYGRVSVTDVDRRGSRSYRVRGVVDASNNYGYNRGYERYDNYRERRAFQCTAREDGRITDFDTDRYRN